MEWPTFSFIGKLTTTGGNLALLNAIKAQSEAVLFVQDGKFKLQGSAARTFAWGTVAAGCYSERAYDPTDPLGGWADGTAYTAVMPVIETPNQLGVDTPSYILHPITLEHIWHFEARPGTAPGPGEIGAVQVVTSAVPPGMGVIWSKDNSNAIVATLPHELGFLDPEGIWQGGLGETCATFRQATGKVRLFHEALTNYSPPSGAYTWSITYSESIDGKTGWTKRPTPFWDPGTAGNIAQQYLPFRGAWQPHFTVDPTNPELIHALIMLSINNGQGKVGYFRSWDGGDTWEAHPGNPVLKLGMPNGPPAEGSLGAPSLFIDDMAGVYWVACDGSPGARGINDFYLAKAPRPAGSLLGAVEAAIQAFLDHGAIKRYSLGSRTVSRGDLRHLMDWRRALMRGQNPGGLNLFRRG